ncbi:hypothetical protein D9757_013695 [Collybiopsis confluens]|uniref:NmrA-like domain-containing protein n=1 Tax=Collybiopsis confluens TaxID=2823264 RepID=A0A8H5GMS8_9AGAR|nr:hypothetical protein D9757_013695 [Collybiopsis confluens]
MDDKKIAIFPASGKLGRSLLRHISEAIDPNQLVLITRFPSKLDNYRDSGAIVRQADYDAPETLENVFSGANTLFLISYASFEHEHRSKAHRTAIDCARRSGVKHIFYSSLAYGAGGGFSKAHVMQAHLDTERYLAKISDEDASFSYTCIREGLYSESFPIYTAFFSLKHPLDEIRIPHNGQAPGIAWAKIDELGEASAAILLSSFHATHDEVRDKNRTILLSGPREWSLTETVQLLGRVIGKEVKIREVTVEEYVAQPHVSEAHTIKGKKMGKEWATAFEAIRDGEASIVTLSLKEILGREPEDFETTVRNLVANA